MRIGQHLRMNPPLVLLAAAVSFGLGGGLFIASHILKNDPTVMVARKKENPYPWLNVSPDKNLKLYAVNRKFTPE